MGHLDNIVLSYIKTKVYLKHVLRRDIQVSSQERKKPLKCKICTEGCEHSWEYFETDLYQECFEFHEK